MAERALRHMPDCAFLSSHPIEGDEAALCNCGAYEEAAGVWALEQQLTGAVDALSTIAAGGFTDEDGQWQRLERSHLKQVAREALDQSGGR